MSPTPSTPAARPAAAPAGGRPARRKWLLPLLLALLLVIALLLLLSQCGDDDSTDSSGDASRATATASAAAPSATASAALPTTTSSGTDGAGTDGGGQTAASGTVTAGSANLLESPTAASLSAQNGQQAAARAVQVQSVPADEGFWVGSSEQDRLWVQLTDLAGESNYKVKQGDSIDFTGTVTSAAQDFAGKVGVTADEGADQLTSQAHYVSVPASSVKLSD